MAKVSHLNYLDVVDEVLSAAKNHGTMHLDADRDVATSSTLRIAGQSLANFGTCGYLGLEQDPRLKRAVIDAVESYGTQFSVSRAYVSSGLNVELEALLDEMYGNPTIVYSSTSICHISVMPMVVHDEDAIVLDQQAHFSMQTAAQLLRPRGVPVEVIRHNNFEMLEDKIAALAPRRRKIWYVVDGVYSMFGDVAPFADIRALMRKHPSLHLYIDDAHGMSWYGRHGAGYAFSECGLDDRTILITTLAKGFGTIGGIAVFSDRETYRRTRTNGGPLIFSHPIAPPLLGASIASAKIHLSDEITTLQSDLAERLAYCNEQLEMWGLPVLSSSNTPIYFVALGEPKVGYNMVRRLLRDGYYVNTAIFPGVPVKRTGLRFTVTRHVSKDQIRGLVEAMAHNYVPALADEGRTVEDVATAFGLPEPPRIRGAESATRIIRPTVNALRMQHARSIAQLDREEWDRLFADAGNFDWEGARFLEEAFQNNERDEENWDFHYFIVRDEKDVPVLATFFTCGLYKDDLLAHESISRQIEAKRESDPYYLVSKTLAMGSMLSEGDHLYLDRAHPRWREALGTLLEAVAAEQDRVGANTVLLRDFDASDAELRDYLHDKGFVKINMPNSNVIDDLTWSTRAEFMSRLSRKNREHVRHCVFRYEDQFEVEIKQTLTQAEAEQFFQLYLNVKRRNYGMNLFTYPSRIMMSMSRHPNWEFVVLRLKAEHDPRPHRPAVAAAWCYRGRAHYSPMILGMDYHYLVSHKLYKQVVFRLIERARELGSKRVCLGLSADTDKRKFGANQIPKMAFVQSKDNFNSEVIESFLISTQDSAHA